LQGQLVCNDLGLSTIKNFDKKSLANFSRWRRDNTPSKLFKELYYKEWQKSHAQQVITLKIFALKKT
jgi:hypothetical protein